MTALPWVLGAVVLAALAAAPVAGTLVRRRRAVATGLDRARSLCARLEAALDAAPDGGSVVPGLAPDGGSAV
ncbi:hypothetical protein, partial [Actinocatenispora thailandica]